MSLKSKILLFAFGWLVLISALHGVSERELGGRSE